MTKQPTDHIEIESYSPTETQLTVSSYHVIDLLTFLKQQNIHASGQGMPTFGTESLPTIYYVDFPMSFQEVLSGVKAYIKSKSLNVKEADETTGEVQSIRLTVSEPS